MRLLLLSALGLSLVAPASAQYPGPSVGVKAGLNVSNFSGDDAGGSEARLGFVGGLTATVPITPTVGFQIEALYSQKGEELDGSIFDSDRDYTIDTRLDYLEIPASLRLSVPASPTLDLGLTLGGYVGVPLSSDIDASGDVPATLLLDLEDDADLETDYGFLIGVDAGSGPFYVDARYTQGLADVFEFDPVTSGLDREPGDLAHVDRQNQVISLTFGYRFGGAAGPRRRY